VDAPPRVVDADAVGEDAPPKVVASDSVCEPRRAVEAEAAEAASGDEANATSSTNKRGHI